MAARLTERARAATAGARGRELAEAVAAGDVDPWIAADELLGRRPCPTPDAARPRPLLAGSIQSGAHGRAVRTEPRRPVSAAVRTDRGSVGPGSARPRRVRNAPAPSTSTPGGRRATSPRSEVTTRSAGSVGETPPRRGPRSDRRPRRGPAAWRTRRRASRRRGRRRPAIGPPVEHDRDRVVVAPHPLGDRLRQALGGGRRGSFHHPSAPAPITLFPSTIQCTPWRP